MRLPNLFQAVRKAIRRISEHWHARRARKLLLSKSICPDHFERMRYGQCPKCEDVKHAKRRVQLDNAEKLLRKIQSANTMESN